MQPTSVPPGARPPVLFHCATCGGATPIGNVHRCALPPRTERRVRAFRRRAAIEVAQKARPKICPDCGGEMEVGGHPCSGRAFDRAQKDARDAELAGFVAALRHAGLQVTQIDNR